MKRDPHVAIIKAAERGAGLRLSAEEVAYLATDDAICERALHVELTASVGRNPKGEDPAEGLRAEHEHAVGEAETPKGSRP